MITIFHYNKNLLRVSPIKLMIGQGHLESEHCVFFKKCFNDVI